MKHNLTITCSRCPAVVVIGESSTAEISAHRLAGMVKRAKWGIVQAKAKGVKGRVLYLCPECKEMRK